MVQGFYTLEEAANILGIPPEELNRRAQKREVRAFADRGTWRFRTQDIDELARQQGGIASDPDIALSDPPKHTTGTAGGPVQTGAAPPLTDDDLIPMDNDVLGYDPPKHGSSAVGLGDLDAGLGGSNPLSPSKAPTLEPGADSDVRLVLEQGSFDFELTTDSSHKRLAEASEPVHSGPPSSKSKLPPEDDSDVRVDFDSTSTLDDSMVGLAKGDSDVRLEPVNPVPSPSMGGKGPDHGLMQTEEIDLDAELQKAEDASLKRRGSGMPPSNKTKAALPKTGAVPPKTGVSPPRTGAASPNKTKAPPPAKGTMLPTSSPFELSEDDLELSAGAEDHMAQELMGSEFELTLAPEDGPSPLALGDDEDVDLGGMPPKSEQGSSARADLSGINLHNPADSGISLEKGGDSDSVDFELTIDDEGTSASGPKTIKGRLPVDSDSEFELTLEEGSSSGSLPQLTNSQLAAAASDGDQKDIFETDFDLPPLEEDDSQSQAVALDGSDTDLESSDFDLAVSDTDLASHGDESGSEVLALDEFEEEEAPKPARRRTDADLSSVDELLGEEELEIEEEPEDMAPATVPAAEAEWGLMPVLLMVPCVLLMFVAGLMSYELLHGMWGYHAGSKPSGLVVKGVSEVFNGEIKD